MYTLLKFPDIFLRKKINHFDFTNNLQDPIELEKNMLDFMYSTNGIGLAANQIGVDARVFVMGHKDNKLLGKAFFNPMIISTSQNILTKEEGCLSFPNIFVPVKRPEFIHAKWQNSFGQWEDGILEGYDCKCFLHELDHLEGIVFKDRVSNLKWNLAIKKGNKR